MSMTTEWIGQCIEDADAKQVYLKNGIRLVGVVLKQDDQAFVLRGQTGSELLIFKDVVSTIVRIPEK